MYFGCSFSEIAAVPQDSLMLPVKFLFPNGLPTDVAKLSSLQKEYLSGKDGEGAVMTMVRLGELKSVYRTISPEESEIIDSKIFEGKFSFIYEPREMAAMKCIQETLKHNAHIKDLILVFGSSHDFSRYCINYGFQHEKVETFVKNT